MTNEEKELLLKDLSARLLYGVRVKLNGRKEISNKLTIDWLYTYSRHIEDIKPYLRPISSMTKKERAEMGIAIQKDRIEPYGEIKNFGEDSLLLCTIRQSTNLQDWLNAYHFDYRGLIPMGLALIAPEGMYG